MNQISEKVIAVSPSLQNGLFVKANKEILETRNYSMFKYLVGNRNVDESRVVKIIESIKTVGYITNPIIVNEHYEIIDGQARLEALKRLGLKVEYIIVEGIGIAECVAMNLFQKNWNVLDFIKSFADQGNPNYIKLLSLLGSYKNITKRVIYSCATGIFVRFKDEEAISKGTFIFSVDYEDAKKELDILSSFLKYQTVGSKREYLTGILFMYREIKDDIEKFRKKMEKYSYKLHPFSTNEEALHALSAIYNINLPEIKKRYFDIEYRRHVARK